MCRDEDAAWGRREALKDLGEIKNGRRGDRWDRCTIEQSCVRWDEDMLRRIGVWMAMGGNWFRCLRLCLQV